MIKIFKKIFGKKEKQEDIDKRQNLLLEKYERGEVLKVDGKTDNVEYLKSLKEENGSK